MQYRSPKATAAAILYHPEKGKEIILLTKRNIEPFKNYWCFPGGHIEIFEKVNDAVKREVKEETNLDFNPTFLNFFEEIFPEKDIHYMVMFFYGEAKGKFLKDEKEVSEIKWFDIKEAKKLKLAFVHNEVLNYYIEHVIK